MTERVCLVGPVHPYRGGIAHFTSVLATEFEKTHPVVIINFKRQYPSLLFPGKTQYDESGEALAVESSRVIDTLDPRSFYKAARAIAIAQCNIAIFQWWHPFFAPAYGSIIFFLRRMAPTKIIFLCHNVLPHESSPMDRLLIRMGFGQVDRFLVQSEEDRRSLLRIKKSARVVVHPHPIYDVFRQDRYTRRGAREELGVTGHVLLFFGYVRPYKGLGVLLDGLARTRRLPETTLLVVGEFYEDKRPYLDRIEKLGIANSVRIVDHYVPNEEVEKYFCACDAVVLPYRSATQSGIVQIAYAFDRPVIVTAVGGLPDVVEDGVTGFVVPPGNPQALAEATDRILEGDRCVEMGRQVEQIKDRFSWSRCKDALVELGS